jgi:hypothetical protein
MKQTKPTGRFFLMVAIGAALISPAWADPITDVNMTIPSPGGRIATSGGEWIGEFAGRVFEGIATLTSGTLRYTESPGFYATDLTFPLTTTGSQARLRLDFTKELLYWSGTALESPSAGLRVSYGGRVAWITGTDTAGAPGIFLSTAANGGYHEHARFSIPSAAPSGLYGFTFVLGPDGASVGTFEPSLPLLITIQKGSLSPEAYTAGMNALVTAALVPEPSTLGMAAAALGMVVVVAVRQRGRKRRTNGGLRATTSVPIMQHCCTCNS